MFRVRFSDQHTEGYGPSQQVNKVAAQLYKLLSRQKMVLSHTDDSGFACYVKAADTKRQRARRACPNCGYKTVA